MLFSDTIFFSTRYFKIKTEVKTNIKYFIQYSYKLKKYIYTKTKKLW